MPSQKRTRTYTSLHGTVFASDASIEPTTKTYIPSPNGANTPNMTHAIYHLNPRDQYILACDILQEAIHAGDIYAMLIALAGIQCAMDRGAIPIA